MPLHIVGVCGGELAQDFDCDLAVKSIRKAIKDTFDGQECVETDKKYLDKWTKSITDGVLKQCQDNCNCKYAGTCNVTLGVSV